MGTFGENLRKIVKERGVKQAWLAAEAEVPEETVSRLMTGKTDDPRVSTARKIAVALNTTVGELLGEEGFEFTALDRAELERIAGEMTRRAEWLRARFDLRPGEPPGARRPPAPRDEEGITYPIGITGQKPE